VEYSALPGTRKRNRAGLAIPVRNRILYDGKMIRLFLRIDFEPEVRLGPGKIRLLELIGETGSISQAAHRMDNMSYRRAWRLVDGLNRMFAEPLVATKLGGSGGGGAAITPLGADLIRRYRDLERETTQLVADRLAPFDAIRRGTGE
jgi:molybdate transport system regulatory protein